MGSPKKRDRGRVLREGRVGYLTVAEQECVATFLERLAQACESQVARVILFGSRVRGDHEVESDIDLLVVTRDGKSAVKEITFELTRDEPCLSVLVLSAREYERHQWLRDPLYVNLRRDGIELWDPEAWLEEE